MYCLTPLIEQFPQLFPRIGRWPRVSTLCPCSQCSIPWTSHFNVNLSETLGVLQGESAGFSLFPPLGAPTLQHPLFCQVSYPSSSVCFLSLENVLETLVHCFLLSSSFCGHFTGIGEGEEISSHCLPIKPIELVSLFLTLKDVSLLEQSSIFFFFLFYFQWI